MNSRNSQIFELAKVWDAKFLVTECNLVSYIGYLTVIGNLTKQEYFSTHPRSNKRRSSILLKTVTKKQDPHHVYLSNEFYKNNVTRFFLVCIHTISNERRLTS